STSWVTSSASESCSPQARHHRRIFGPYRATNWLQAAWSRGSARSRPSSVTLVRDESPPDMESTSEIIAAPPGLVPIHYTPAMMIANDDLKGTRKNGRTPVKEGSWRGGSRC